MTECVVQPKGPGEANLSIRGAEVEQSIRAAFQRSADYKYLGNPDHGDEMWQTAESWHELRGKSANQPEWCGRLDSRMIDALIAASPGAVQMTFTDIHGVRKTALLRIEGRLLGSVARKISGPMAKIKPVAKLVGETDPITDLPSSADSNDGLDPLKPQDAMDVQAGAENPEAKRVVKSRRWLYLLVFLLLLVGALIGFAQYFGWFRDHTKGTVAKDEVPAVEEVVTFDDKKIDGGSDDGTGSKTPPEQSSTNQRTELRGRSRAQAYLSGTDALDPEAMFAQGHVWEQENDCDAAMIVYHEAAQRDAAMAAEYARRYDPDTYTQGGCIAAPHGETAAYWYEKAAEEGDVTSQRQLGKILIQSYPSGILHEQGLQWLRQAAQAGDTEAQAILQAR